MHARFASGLCTASIDPRLRGISARRLPPSARVMTARDTVGVLILRGYTVMTRPSVYRAATKETGQGSRLGEVPSRPCRRSACVLHFVAAGFPRMTAAGAAALTATGVYALLICFILRARVCKWHAWAHCLTARAKAAYWRDRTHKHL